MTRALIKWIKANKPLVLITILGAFLRFYRLGASLQFLGDQGRDAIVLKRMLVDFDLPFIGPITSVGGFYLGPLYYYLMAPFLWLFGFNPAGPAYATALIGVATIPAIYLVAKKLFSQKTALWASMLYAFASIPVMETRGAWNPNPMPLAALGLVFGFNQALKSKDKRWLWLSAVSLGVALQLHYMIVFLSPFILWQLILVLKDKKLKKSIISWLGIILLMLLPLILFEIKNNFLNLNGLIEYLTKNEYGDFNWWQTIRNLKGRSEEAIGMLLGFGRNTNFLRTLVTNSFLLAMTWLWLKYKSYSLKMVSLWLILSIGAIAFFRGSIPPYYLGFIFPAVFILAGRILAELKGWLLPIGLSFVVIFTQVNFQQLSQVLTAHGNLNSVKKTAQFIVDDIRANDYQDYNVTLIDGTRDYRASSFRYFIELYGGKPLDIDQYPETKVLYVVSPYVQDDVASIPIWEIKSLRPIELEESWEFEDSENIYKIVKL